MILKAAFESSLSNLSFRRLDPGALNVSLIGSTCTGLPGSARIRSGTPLHRPLTRARAPAPRATQWSCAHHVIHRILSVPVFATSSTTWCNGEHTVRLSIRKWRVWGPCQQRLATVVDEAPRVGGGGHGGGGGGGGAARRAVGPGYFYL